MSSFNDFSSSCSALAAVGGESMRTAQRPARKQRLTRPKSQPDDKARAEAKARCAEVAMLAAAKGWGKKPTSQ
jgi:hypothetical protein